MKHLVLVTRPLEQATEFAARLDQSGFSSLICPLLSIEFLSIPHGFPDSDVVCATSVQSFSGGHDFSALASLPLYCVGEASADKARQAGFSHVIVGGGDVSSLTKKMVDDLPAGTRILYLRGETISTNLAATLPCYHWEEKVLYRAVALEQFPDDILQKFDQISVIVVFSPRSGQILSNLVHCHRLENEIRTIKLLSLSPSVLESVGDLDWEALFVSEQPDTDSMLSALTRLLKE